MNNKLKIGVVFGGTSNEREVSLSSGLQVINNLDKNKYEIKIYDPKINLKELTDDCLAKKIDFCFIALHGKYGEDGSIQGMLDLFGIPYNGSGAMSSALCMDKSLAKKLVKDSGISVADDLIIEKNEWLIDRISIFEKIIKQMAFPLVVKPNISGSSVGVTIVKDNNLLIKAIEESFNHDARTIVEEYIKGIEVTAPILENRAFPLIEIVPENEFFDYEAKYTIGKCQEIIPARINDELSLKIKNEGLKIAKILKCRGLSRVDFIIRNDELLFLEINTLPGMTENSLCPKSAKADGLNFPDLLDKIIELSLKNDKGFFQ